MRVVRNILAASGVIGSLFASAGVKEVLLPERYVQGDVSAVRKIESAAFEKFGSSGINVGQTEEAEDLYLYADASHTQIFRPNRRGYNARANDLNLPILWLDF